jgi:hypothetical protein
MTSTLRLPGIQFDVVSPAASETLVRMDIAAFVGFAARGPLHQPVAVEDIVQFQEIFGGDLVIAGDPRSNQPVYAYLPSAVRAFFRNGGRRCWIIRVAGEGAAYGMFPLPGLSTFDPDPFAPVPIGQAMARARSQGSWSDGLVVGLALRSEPLEVTDLLLGSPPGVFRFNAVGALGPGDLLRLTDRNTGSVLWVFLDSITPAGGGPTLTQSKPGQNVTVTATQFWGPSGSPPSIGPTPTGELITMDMFVQSEKEESWSLTDLGFAPAHPRYWASLPDDATLYATDSPAGLAAEAAHPRFPLAGPVSAGLFLPLEVRALPLVLNGPQLPAKVTPLERDGVSKFGADLFLDSSLADTGIRDLLNEAYYIQYQSSVPRPLTKIQAACGIADSRKLTGIHAALAVTEATIICAPDAVQPGWSPVQDTPLASPPASSPLQHPEWWHFLDCRKKQEIPRVSSPPPGQFQPCDLLIIDAPVLSITKRERDRFSLSWLPMAGAVDFLEEAVDPAFASANPIYIGSSGDVMISGRPPGDYYYRLRRQIGEVSSDYSNPVAWRVETAGGWQVNAVSANQNDTLLAVHQGLLRMAAARGDLFAVLSMPEHYRERESLAYSTRLISALDDGEQFALSFGGLYHPWLIGREENDLSNLRSNPPDGAAAGVMANRSSSRGPWISPANEPLHGVVALQPAVSRAFWLALQDAQINLFRQEPDGFLALSATTLSPDPDLTPISVRRLLSFLRKTVLLVGVDYVFEPNNDVFRRGLQRGFERLLESLFVRGAFAGRIAREAFQVVTDSRVNTAEAMDAGRFFVELRVAPSLPLRFLTVRLVQTADRTLVTEGQ